MGVIFLDLDSTLIDLNSSKVWVGEMYRAGSIRLSQLLRASWTLARYRLGATDISGALEGAIRELKGWPADEFAAQLLTLADRVVDAHLRPEVRPLCAAYRARGERLVILSSASQILVDRVAERLALDAAIGNRFAVDDEGALSGALDGPLVFGAEKIDRAREFLLAQDAAEESHRFTLEESAFYSDSYADLPLLERVGRPRVVCPDQRLHRAARARAWPVLNWGRAGETPTPLERELL